MGYFNIVLPQNKKGSVRFGPIKKMKTISAFFRRKKVDPEALAYIVTIDLEEGNQKAFYIMKTTGGEWMDTAVDGEVLLVKKAIDQHEMKLLMA